MARIIGTAGSAPPANATPKRKPPVVQPNPDQRVPSKPAPRPPVRRPVPRGANVVVRPSPDARDANREARHPSVSHVSPDARDVTERSRRVPGSGAELYPTAQGTPTITQRALDRQYAADVQAEMRATARREGKAPLPNPFTPHPVAGMLGAERRTVRALGALELSGYKPPKPAGHGPGNLLATADFGGLQVIPSAAHVLVHSLHDLGTLAVGPFVGGYELGDAAVTALRGHPGAATHKLTGLAKGIAEPFKEQATHPIRYLSQHPLLSVLNVAGAESALGRTEGALARGVGRKGATGVRGALDEHAHVVRPPVSMTNDAGQPGLVQRSYSKDVHRRAIQVSRDRQREPLRDAHGNVVTVTDRGREVPVLKSSEGEQERLSKRRADFHASRGNMRERAVRDQATKDSKVRGVRGGAAKDIVAMAAEGTITSAKHFEADLRAHRARLAGRIQRGESGAEPYRHAGDLEAARNRLALVDKVLASPKAMAQAERIVAEGERHGRQLNAGDAESVAAGLIDPNAAKRAALSVPALEHMGARHFTVEEHQALERDAGKAEKAAAEAYTRAKTPAERAQAAADLHAAREHRIAVSGREPDGVRTHEDANARLAVAQAHSKAAHAAEETQTRVVQDLVTRHKSERGREAHHGPVAKYEVHKTPNAALVDAAKQGRASVAARLTAIDRRMARLGQDYHNAEQLSGMHAAEQVRADIETLNQARVDAFAHLQRLDRQLGTLRTEHALRSEAIAAAKAAKIPLRQIKRIALTSGEAKRVGEISNARRALGSIKARRRAADKAIVKAQRAVKENPRPETKAALRYGENNPFGKPAGGHLPNADIEAFLRSRGRDPESVAYLPHRQDVVGARAHHAQARPGQRPVLDAGETRTGEAYRSGVTESSRRLLHDQGVRQKVLLNKAQQLDRLVADHGLRHPAFSKAQRGEKLTPGEQRIVDKGGLFTAKEAAEFAQRLERDKGQRLTPMRAMNASLSTATKRLIREDFQGPGGMETLPQHLLNDRIVRPGDTIDSAARNVVLVPSALVGRLEEHLRPAGHLEKFFQYLNRPFRMAVLPQPRWLTGNFMEAQVVRLGVKGSGLVNVFGLGVDLMAARRALSTLDKGTPEMQRAAQEIRAQQTGAGLFIGGRGANVHRTAEEVMPQAAQRAYGRMVSKLPVVGQMTEMTRSAAHWIAAPLNAYFELNRRAIEAPAQRAAFGHQFREDVQAVTGSWVKSITLSKRAVEDAAQGLVNTPAQHRFMLAQHELLGKYAGFSPRTRAVVQSVAPFLPWALNAARFVYWTMPAHHSALTALLVATNQAVQKDWTQIHSDTPPGDLRDAIPNGKGGWIDLARYTPYGLTEPPARGDVSGLTGFFVPQAQGVQSAIQGRDPFGNDLRVAPTAANPQGKPSTGQKVGIAANEGLEAMVPYLAQGRRLLEHGETAYANSTILSPKTKPGTSHGMSGVRRTFDPFRPTYLRAGSREVVVQPKGGSPRRAASRDPWGHVSTQPAAQTQAASPWDLVK